MEQDLVLELSDFVALIQLAATINLAYMAVEYAKSYTGAIARNIFKFGEIIKANLVKCESHIDKQTIDNLEPCVVNGKTTIVEIERIRRESSKLFTEIKETREELELTVTEKCDSKGFAAISLYLFLFSSVCLLCCGISSFLIVKWFYIIFTLISVLYLVLGFFFAEDNRSKKLSCAFKSMESSIIIFIVILFLSIGLGLFLSYKYGDTPICFWNISLLVSSIIPFVNFIVYILKIKFMSKSIKDEILGKIQDLENRCISLEDDVKKLETVKNLSKKLSIAEKKNDSKLNTNDKVNENKNVTHLSVNYVNRNKGNRGRFKK